ncbi:hypothetical protein JTE90_010636 [Oedothorax gibbosus]|uniref:MYND-type domain-containing protein n=1 Tax=Oedothorax gibbosus TaxID=931172 RepID=A0AAV6VGE9_9ARAC|nr:hypothetical protein JTE90_010636 [Oedothorax gibbosus]
MRALTLRPDDADLFGHFATPEHFGFFMTHLPAFKRMWEAEGKVYWLRFLLCIKDTFQHTLENKPEFEFMFETIHLEQLQSLIYINIHKKFVQSTYGVAKSFMEQAFVLTKNLSNLKEQTRMKNPFYAKETREAFRALLGKPEVDEDIPFVPVTYMASMYGFFVASVCTLLKRWLKEPDLSEEAKKKVDYTHFYWKPHPEWSKAFWPTCFEEYLAHTYNTDLPKMLLTSNIHEIFFSHYAHDPCVGNCGDITIFDILRHDEDDYDEEVTDDDEPFLMNQIGYLQPQVQNCVLHSNCYKKVLHNSKCFQPYLCNGSDICKVTCEKTKKNMHIDVPHTTFWKKITCETFACKGSSKKRHVSTLALSQNTQIETFVHVTESLDDSSKICKDLQESIQAEMECDFTENPEFINSFNQQKRREDVKNKLRNKLSQKYSFREKFNDPDFRHGLFEGAQKLWFNNNLSEELSIPIFSNNQQHKKWAYAAGSIFNSMKNVQTTIAVGTHSISTGRIVTSTSSKACCPTPVCMNVKPELPIAVPCESKSKKTKKKKKKGKASNENKDVPALDTNNSAMLSTTTTHQNSCPLPEIPTLKPDAKEHPAQLPESLIAIPTESKPKSRKKGNTSNENKDASVLSTNNATVPSNSTQLNSCNQPSLPTQQVGIKENPAQLPELKAVPNEPKSKSKKKKKGNASKANGDAPALSQNNPPTHILSTVQTDSASNDSQANVKKPASVIKSTFDKSLEIGDKSRKKSESLTVEKSKNTEDANVGESKTCESSNGEIKSIVDTVVGESNTCESSNGGNKSIVDAVVGESKTCESSNGGNKSAVDGESKSTGLAVDGEKKSSKDVAENTGQLCFPGCIPTFKTGHECTEKCCCPGCDKKNSPTLTDSKLASNAVITKKPKKRSDSKVNEIEDLVINKSDKQFIEQTKSATVDLNNKAEKTEKPVADENLKGDLSGDSDLDHNAKQAVEKEMPKDSMAVSHDSTENRCLDALRVLVDEFINSPEIEVDELYKKEAEKVLEDNQPTEDSSDLKVKLIQENGVECQNENEGDNLSDAVALEAHAAISNLKFESKEDKPVEDFLTLIGVLKDNSSAISETNSCTDAPLTNAKGDSDVKNKKLKLKTCAFCSKKEVTPKTFKRCAKCKSQNFAVQRYYCSRECQIDDWQESHRDEHLKNLL